MTMDRPWLDPALDIEARLDALMAEMTLDDKVGQTHQVANIDPAEDVYITEQAIPLIPVEGFGTSEALVAAVKRTGAAHIYLHIDLDVLDPATIVGLSNIYPFGLAVESLTGAIVALRGEFTLAGATIAGFAPSSPEAANDDLPSILRIIGALTR